MRPFGQLEAAVMQDLWQRKQPASVRDVLGSLNDSRTLAYTTVLTVMDNLHRKGQLTREMRGRAWRYWPVRSRAEHAAALLQDVLIEVPDREEVLRRFVADLDAESVAQLRAAMDAVGAAHGDSGGPG